MTLHRNYAYVGTIFGKQNRLAVVDINEPDQPRLVTEILGPDMGHASGQIAGQKFYAVNWDRNAFFVFDLTKPGRLFCRPNSSTRGWESPIVVS